MNRINLITLGVRDIGKSLKFYRKIGFEASVTGDEEKPVIVFLRMKDQSLSYFHLKNWQRISTKKILLNCQKGGSRVSLSLIMQNLKLKLMIFFNQSKKLVPKLLKSRKHYHGVDTEVISLTLMVITGKSRTAQTGNLMTQTC